MASLVENAFVAGMDQAAMDAKPKRQLGENGSVEFTAAGVGDDAVALFFALVRGCEEARVRELMLPLLKTQEGVVTAFVMAFQTRNCRGGKGERELFRFMFLTLIDAGYVETAVDVLGLVKEHGSYKDLVQLAEACQGAGRARVLGAITALFASTLREDEKKQAAGKKFSLAAKWAPREGKATSAYAKTLALAMFPAATARRDYRQLVAKLNKALDTTEVKMCGGRWADIEPSAVASVCLFRNRKALLNEQLKKAPSPEELETGNRKQDEDRVRCRKRVREALTGNATKRLKGKQLFPHEIVKMLLNRRQDSAAELEVLDSQWTTIREGVSGLGETVALVDVSGSMQGTPMEVAIALGLLISECASEPFKNRVITFDSNPQWFVLEEGTIAEKVASLSDAPWGSSTDFAEAMEMILRVCVAKKLRPEQVPNLVVLSDMQFDCADRSWETHHERIVRQFAQAGITMCGEPWPTPQITYWNLRGDTSGFPASADSHNVRLLSGFSPALLKLIMDGDELTEVLVDEEGNAVTKAVVDPKQTLAKALDDTAYDQVRVKLASSNELLLEGYAFTPVVIEAEDDSETVIDADFILVD